MEIIRQNLLVELAQKHLTEVEYQQLAAQLDDLLDIVGEENHPLVPLLHLVGTLVKDYEDAHVPRLTDI